MIRNLFRRRDERGVTAIEYGILASLIAIVTIGAVTLTGGQLSTTFASIGNHLGAMGSSSSDTACDADGNYAGPQLWIKFSAYDDGAAQVTDASGTSWFGGQESTGTMVSTGWIGVPAEQLGTLPADQQMLLSNGLPARADDGVAWQMFGDTAGCATNGGGSANPSAQCTADTNRYDGDWSDYYWYKLTFYTDGQQTTGTDTSLFHQTPAAEDGTMAGWVFDNDPLDNVTWTTDISQHTALYTVWIGYLNSATTYTAEGDVAGFTSAADDGNPVSYVDGCDGQVHRIR